MGRPHSDLGLPTTKHERVLDSSTISYKTATGGPHFDPALPTTNHERIFDLDLVHIIAHFFTVR